MSVGRGRPDARAIQILLISGSPQNPVEGWTTRGGVALWGQVTPPMWSMEAVADALDLLDEQVQAFGRPVADTREVML